MALGLRGSKGVAAPPYTAGPYTWDQQVTFSAGVSGLNTPNDILYVDNVKGSTGGNGSSWNDAYSTITLALAAASAGTTIYVAGTGTDYSEAVTVSVDGISLIAVGPRNLCGWTSLEDTTIITVAGAGTRISGFYLRPNGTTSGYAIDISETGTTQNTNYGCIIDNNIFKSSTNTCVAAILADGVPDYVRIYHNFFTWCTNGIYNTAQPNSAGTGWEIIGNSFTYKCATGIRLEARRSTVKDNSFKCETVSLNVYGVHGVGGYNQVHGNYINGTYATSCVSNATDDWAGNFLMTIGGTGLPAAVPGGP